MKRNQKGITLIGFVVILGLVGVFIYVGMKLIPMYTEYYGVKQAMKGLSLEPGINNSSPDHIRSLFTRRLYVNYSENVESKHVKIERIEGGWRMNVAYEVRKPIIGNLDVVGKFAAVQDLKHGGPGKE